jgi:hypothetical protein
MERVDDGSLCVAGNVQSVCSSDCVGGGFGHVNCGEGCPISALRFLIHHENRMMAGSDHALYRRTNKDIQKLLSVRAHDDEVWLDRLSRPQDTVERVSRNHARPAGDLLQLRHRSDLLVEDAFGLPRFQRNQILGLVVVHHMDEIQVRPMLSRQ